MTTLTTPMDCDGLADVLADYLDGDAPDGVRTSVERHAGTCAECRQLLADLSAISANAAALPPLVPSRDLWEGVAERIAAPVLAVPLPATRVSRRAWLRPALAAAALVGITAGVTHYATRASLSTAVTGPRSIATAVTSAATPVMSPVTADPAPATAQISSTATESPARTATRSTRSSGVARLASAERATDAADPVFASEITKLRRIVRDRRGALDPKTVAVLEQSIAVMDSAIAQSRAALAHDPASGFLAMQLNHSLEKKVELLRTAALLPTRL